MPAGKPPQPPENRGNQPVPLSPIPLAEMLERLAAAGLEDASDRMYRWRKAGMLGQTLPSGDGNARLVAPLDAARLQVIAWLHTEFETSKIPDEELAFWLAAAGDRDMPTGLVMDGVVRGTGRYMRNFMGLLGKRVGGRWMLDEPDRETIAKASTSVTTSLKRMFESGIDLASSLAMKAAFNLLFTQILNPTNEAGAAKNIGVVLRRVGATEAQVVEWTPHVWDGLQEVSTFFREGDDNAFIKAADDCRDFSRFEAMRAARHAYLMYDMLLRVIPELKQFKPARVMVPMIAGMLLHIRNNEFSQNMRKRIDEGAAPLHEGLNDMLAMRVALLERFFGWSH